MRDKFIDFIITLLTQCPKCKEVVLVSDALRWSAQQFIQVRTELLTRGFPYKVDYDAADMRFTIIVNEKCRLLATKLDKLHLLQTGPGSVLVVTCPLFLERDDYWHPLVPFINNRSMDVYVIDDWWMPRGIPFLGVPSRAFPFSGALREWEILYRLGGTKKHPREICHSPERTARVKGFSDFSGAEINGC